MSPSVQTAGYHVGTFGLDKQGGPRKHPYPSRLTTRLPRALFRSKQIYPDPNKNPVFFLFLTRGGNWVNIEFSASKTTTTPEIS
ncbi:MAG: hypothetical protein ABR568_11540 [Pyrinomonadaceae bacterium]